MTNKYVTFDTLACIRRLKKAGVKSKQAKDYAKTISFTITELVVTLEVLASISKNAKLPNLFHILVASIVAYSFRLVCIVFAVAWCAKAVKKQWWLGWFVWLIAVGT